MDLISGIAAAGQAVQLVKDLRAIDRTVDEASFKLKLADLAGALADTRLALAQATETIADRNVEIASLKSKLESATSGESCPICGTGRLKTVQVRPHPTFGELGVQEKFLKCESPECGHTEQRMHDPAKIVRK